MFYAPPAWLVQQADQNQLVSAYALDVWARTAPLLVEAGRLDPMDMPSFEVMCLAWGTAMASQRLLMDDGILVKADRGGDDVTKKSGAAQVWKDNMAIYAALADRFGLNPKARWLMKAERGASTGPRDGLLD